jgi:hypothetical protein
MTEREAPREARMRAQGADDENDLLHDERHQHRAEDDTEDALARMEREAAATPDAEDEGTVGARWNVPDPKELDRKAREADERAGRH